MTAEEPIYYRLMPLSEAAEFMAYASGNGQPIGYLVEYTEKYGWCLRPWWKVGPPTSEAIIMNATIPEEMK